MNETVKSFSRELPDSLEATFNIFNAAIHSSAMCCELIILFYFLKKFPIDSLLRFIIGLFSLNIIIRIITLKTQYKLKVGECDLIKWEWKKLQRNDC